MRCEQARDRIGLLVDGELSTPDAEALTAHAAECPDCARYRDDLTRLRGHLLLMREEVPARLAARVSAALSVEASDNIVPRSSSLRERLISVTAPHLRMVAAILLACMVSAAGTALWLQRSDDGTTRAREALAAHVRSLLQDTPVQVASFDTHTVKPWFAGRLDYAPVVKDLSGEGFQLVGGRLDYVEGQRVAALVYKRRLHQISVFVLPSGGRAAAPFSARFDGINVLGWSKAGMSYWAVSDLNEGELRELQSLI